MHIGRPTAKGSPHALHFCKSALALPSINAALMHTIPTVESFAKRPSTVLAHVGAAIGGIVAYAGHTGPTLTYLRGRCSPRVQHETMGDGCVSRDTVEGPLYDSEQPTAMAMMFS